MKGRILILVIGLLAVVISSYNILAGGSLKSNLVGFIFGISTLLLYFGTNKSKQLKG